MKQAIVILLKKDKKIEQIRKKYISDYKKFKPHITLVYPFEIANQTNLHEHIKEAISKMKPFELSLEGLKKSAKEYHLYLLVDSGKEKIIELHRNLNSNLLKNFKNKNLPRYTPHLSLGVFKTKKEINKAIKKIRKENINFKTKVSSIHLLTVNKKHKLISKKCFKL